MPKSNRWCSVKRVFMGSNSFVRIVMISSNFFVSCLPELNPHPSTLFSTSLGNLGSNRPQSSILIITHQIHIRFRPSFFNCVVRVANYSILWSLSEFDFDMGLKKIILFQLVIDIFHHFLNFKKSRLFTRCTTRSSISEPLSPKFGRFEG